MRQGPNVKLQLKCIFLCSSQILMPQVFVFCDHFGKHYSLDAIKKCMKHECLVGNITERPGVWAGT